MCSLFSFWSAPLHVLDMPDIAFIHPFYLPIQRNRGIANNSVVPLSAPPPRTPPVQRGTWGQRGADLPVKINLDLGGTELCHHRALKALPLQNNLSPSALSEVITDRQSANGEGEGRGGGSAVPVSARPSISSPLSTSTYLPIGALVFLFH